MRQTIVLRQTQLIGIRDSLVGIRVEIDGIIAHLHLRKQLLTDQFRPNLLHRRLGVVVKRDLVRPRRSGIRRVRQNDVMGILDTHTGNHKISSVSIHAVELIGRGNIFDIRLVAITTVSPCNHAFVRVQIMRRGDAGVLDTRISRSRPAEAGGKQPRPGIVGNDGIRIGVIQTQILIAVRLVIFVEDQRINATFHRFMFRAQHIFALFTFCTYTLMTNDLVRCQVIGIGVVGIADTLAHVGPVAVMTGTGVTRRTARMRQEVPFAVLFEERDSNVDGSFVRRLSIQMQCITGCSVF